MSCTQVLGFLLFTFSLTAAVQAQPQIFTYADPQGQSAESGRQEDELYEAATKDMDNGNYDKAIYGYDRVIRMHGRRADAALYWRAYALHKLSRNQEAQQSIDELNRTHSNSTWRREARLLEHELRRSGSKADVDPAKEADDEIKILALNSLMQSDPEKGVAAAGKLLQGDSSDKVKERALFVLAQSKSDKAQEMLLSVAKGTSNPELQAHAIKWLAIAGGMRNSQTLQEIYASALSNDVKKQVLRSFIINRDKDALFKIAQQEKTPELKCDAIRQLGVLRAAAELSQLYKSSTDPETKECLLKSMSIAGNQEALIEIAKSEADPGIRRHAIRNLGITEGQAATDALVAAYNSNADVDTRREVIRALFVHRDAKDLVALARKETNPELRRELVRELSVMHSPEANEYMLELLNK
jgi:HEAT repeat protein